MKTRQSWNIGSALAAVLLLGPLAAITVDAQPYTSQIEALNPLDYWQFDETNPSPAPAVIHNLGSLGSAQDGYAAGGALIAQPGGIVGNCVQLINDGDTVGACNTRIDIPNSPALNPQPPFTIEFWAKPTSISSDSTGLCVLSSLSPFPFVSGSTRAGYLFYLNQGNPAGGTWAFRLGGFGSYSAAAYSTAKATSNEWSHIVGEFDGTTASIYVNGVLSGSGLQSLSSPFNPNPLEPTRLGGSFLAGSEYADGNGNIDTGEGNRGYDGFIDEFAVYTYLLSSNTIMAHYTAGTSNTNGYDSLVLSANPVGYWNMDEASNPPPSTFPIALDIGSLADSGTNTFGALVDQPGIPTLSAADKSVYYNGAVGSLSLSPPAAPFDFGGHPITLAAWIKPNTFQYMEDIISQGYDETTYAQNFLCVGDVFDWESYSPDNSGGDNNTNIVPGAVYYSVGTYDGGSAYNTAVFPAPPGDAGNWVFLVGSYDGTNWNLYRNGTLVSSFDDDGTGPTTLTEPWSVGSRSSPSPYFGFFFDGAIDEASIFTNALDAATISNLYSAVELPPVITQAPVAPSPAYLGSDASLSVWADGSAPLSYQWTSNGVAISGQTATNFSLAGLTADYSATYAVVVTNNFGAVTSAVALLVTGTLPPVTVVPALETRWFGFPITFGPASLPNQLLSFQWNLNGDPITGATLSTYTSIASNNVGSYTLVISNSFGTATSTVATLSILTPPAGYASAILGDSPLSYFRLDETNGTVAYDYAGGNDGNYYGSQVLTGQPGYSLIDPDFAVTFPGVADNYIGDIGATSIDFHGTSAKFSLEAWANGPAGQTDGAAIIAKGVGNNGGTADEQFALAVSGGNYRFFVRDPTVGRAISEADANTGPDGAWHHLVGVCDEVAGTLTLYIDGVVNGSAGTPAAGIEDSAAPVSIGAERSGVLPPYDWPYNGTIDEVAIYNTALTAGQVSNHYALAYGTNLIPQITIQPVSATNYVNLPVSFTVAAVGTVPITYQWDKVGSGPVTGQTTATFTIPNLAFTDAGTYTCGITNSVGGILSTSFVITVLAPPTSNNPPALSGLVMHLTFDGNLDDVTGRGNNGTNMASGGAPLLTNDYVPGQIGQAFTYQTTVTAGSAGTTNANYASVGVRPDLQFSTNDFSVSMWVQLPANYIGNDLPFFCDVVGSTFSGPGFCFEPSFGTTVGTTMGWPGGWGFSVYDAAGNGIGVYGDQGTINDGAWHNLVYVIDKTANVAVVYLDGVASHQNKQAGTSLSTAGSIDATVAATIGQDPTGLYPQPSDGNINIDDLGVWNRALAPLEAASIYTAGFVNQVTFTGGTNAAPVTLGAATVTAGSLQLTWSAGSLQGATNLSGPWTNVPGATSPFTTNTAGPQQFFRVLE